MVVCWWLRKWPVARRARYASTASKRSFFSHVAATKLATDASQMMAVVVVVAKLHSCLLCAAQLELPSMAIQISMGKQQQINAVLM